MNGPVFLLLSAIILIAESSMPHGLRMFLQSGRYTDENSTRMSKMPTRQFDQPEEIKDSVVGRLSSLQSSIEEARKNYDSGDFALYTPPPVKHNEAECYVESQVPRREPGRCIKLAGITPACQTETFLSPNHHMCS